MGNQLVGIEEKDAKQFTQFLKSHQRKSVQSNRTSQKITFNLEIKWRNQLLNILQNLKKNTNKIQLCDDMTEVVKQIKHQSFIKAVSIFNAINSHQLTQLKSKTVLKDSYCLEGCRQSDKVFLQAELRNQINNSKQSVSTIHSNQGSPERKKHDTRQIKKNINQILIRQINQMYHPFYHLKQSFMMIIGMKYRIRLNDYKEITQKIRDEIYEDINKDIDFYTQFVGRGCYIYKKWIIKCLKIKQQKYPQFIKKIILDSLFQGHQSFHKILFPIVKQLNFQYINKICQKINSNISVQKFAIDKDLQIQGTYIRSSILLGDFDKESSPKNILKALEKLKLQICNDIDLYHKLFKTDKTYKIDGDNFLGIICFLLCKLKYKMLEIYTQIALLQVIYGDNACVMFQSASYMITSIQASFDYLSSSNFPHKSMNE